jgi:hypothetical protein
LLAIPEKLLLEHAEATLATAASDLLKRVAALGKLAGAPWGKDQKDATLAAMIAWKLGVVSRTDIPARPK